MQYTHQSINSPSNQGKSQAPPQTKQCGWQTPSFKLKRVARKAQGFSMQKTILPLNQGNQTKCQIQLKMPTPPEVENTRFHQLSLDTPQDKHRPLK
jgi:hypothetical protein